MSALIVMLAGAAGALALVAAAHPRAERLSIRMVR
jgi:hypothetical protein